MKKFFTVVLFASGLMMVAAHAQAQTKIGYISSQEVIGIMPETRKADSSLTDYRNALLASAQEKQTAFYAAYEKFIKDSTTMSDAVKTVKRTELNRLSTELGGEEERIQNLLQQKRDELIMPINKKAFDAIQAVAKESGYTYVFEKEALLVAPPAEDILPLVAKKLNIKLPAAGAGNAPAAAPAKKP
ncbi:OmpH family outer membrane protein [Pseudobacter ginsenosidimutans]|uniref:Periplasmic chaperone for outer membrane proteins Skp n=1 Tax=Pseudobacter ginsenosidimutans TaxID=661488 RepID=A0A4Q7MTV2_9BACT|nr:OmpH family outer membrane protein [Pseudobacter ginsenosidimutans]RZS72057.1 periplasmic chaperone for outer membrane proteins Skp [Pseudobacter ginsenosidimutans]